MSFNQVSNTWATSQHFDTESTQTTESAKPVEKTKRKQVKNACVNCQKACKKCDDGRPCKRCIKLGLTATCRDSDRKERKKGVKRGPYKKRQAYIKDKPVYPKLTEEQQQQNWNAPIYENVPQVLSQAYSPTPKMPSPLTISTNQLAPSLLSPQHTSPTYSNPTTTPPFFFDEEFPCVPSQGNVRLLSSLSPTSASSFEFADETLHYAYGYTNNQAIPSSSPSSMLDHQTISGNITPIQDEFYSWDDNTLASPIGSHPITDPMGFQKEITMPLFDFNQMMPMPWIDNDLSLGYQPQQHLIQPQQHLTQQPSYLDYIPPQQMPFNTTHWSF
ncbi:putative transcriptional regulatory protein C27B12.11c [Choanephora cucurbitarum]|uniref:Putative transcriptional regulatory protein C27B12.11c n=1 Tax=Choanephora cucurbitarum TaxID=101091 RepID=A0A1C7NFN9_9FUNG|nr:putative transcriptional regulatory protein C27B12.11c [Choanephora cucurbitarum]